MAVTPLVSLADLPPELQPPEPAPAAKEKAPLDELEKTHILQVLEACRGNQAAAAKRLGIGRNTLWRKLKKYGVD